MATFCVKNVHSNGWRIRTVTCMYETQWPLIDCGVLRMCIQMGGVIITVSNCCYVICETG